MKADNAVLSLAPCAGVAALTDAVSRPCSRAEKPMAKNDRVSKTMIATAARVAFLDREALPVPWYAPLLSETDRLIQPIL